MKLRPALGSTPSNDVPRDDGLVTRAMPNHNVRAGECVSSIADAYGFFWSTVWNHGDNAELKRKRKDPNTLLEGDVLFVPEKTLKNADCGSERKHTFRRKGVPAKLKIRLVLDDEPRANEPYHLTIDGRTVQGTTDADGFLEQRIPPAARRGVLRVGAGPVFDVFELALGGLDPLDTDSGVEGRLRGLGYRVDGGDLSPAVRAFQAKEQLNETGRVDAETRERLKQRFGQ